ncbi:MAG: class I SAM-dependent methyltransferase [Dehalococcoidia bacterium]|nr:class I SAM-dependent methyltransferase [Dehalococcoidia bacterium]
MNSPDHERGHRWFAAVYDRLTGPAERRLFKEIRPRIIGEAEGRVLEIGAGTGASFEYYARETHVVGTEPDPFMLARARRRVEELGAEHIELHQAPAEALPFEDGSFDHVVSSLVLCTVSDVPRALAEVRRVLKPDGTFRFIEHVRNDDSRFWGTVQDVIAPVWRWIGAGCNPTRRTQQAIEEAGFRLERIELIRVAPGTPGIFGTARPG